MSSSPLFLDSVIVPLITGNTVLDVGCGYGRWGHLIKYNFWEASGLTSPPMVDGLDAFDRNVEYCSESKVYRKVWQQILPSPLEGSWDTVLMCECLEHIAQDKVLETVELLEGVARRRIIFSTPNFLYLRGGGDTFLGFNDYEAHLSYIPRQFFKDRGYKVTAAGFSNPNSYVVRGVKRLIPKIVPALESLPRAFPSLGFLTVAYKDF